MELPQRGKRRCGWYGSGSTAARDRRVRHAIYLDRLAVVDAFGKATTLSDFEPDGATCRARVANPYAGSWTSQASNQNRVLGVRARSVTGEVPGVEGPTVLRLEYFMNKISGVMREPSIVVNEVQTGRVPVVVNRAFAELFGGRGPTRTAIDKPLEPGEMRNLILNMGPGSVEIGYEVVGVIDTLPSVDARDPLLITLTDRIRPIINQASSSSVFFDERGLVGDAGARAVARVAGRDRRDGRRDGRQLGVDAVRRDPARAAAERGRRDAVRWLLGEPAAQPARLRLLPGRHGAPAGVYLRRAARSAGTRARSGGCCLWSWSF